MGGAIPQRLMNPLHVVEEEVPAQAPAGVRDHGVLMEIDFLILDRSPETFHKDVVVHAAPAIHLYCSI